MKLGKFQVVCCVVAFSAASAFCAGTAPASLPHVAGSYQVLQQSKTGSKTQVRMSIRLQNHTVRDLRIQRITLWQFSHPSRGGTQACSIALHHSGAAELTPEFTLSASEYELLQHGSHPRLVLEVVAPDGRVTNEIVHLNPRSGKREN